LTLSYSENNGAGAASYQKQEAGFEEEVGSRNGCRKSHRNTSGAPTCGQNAHPTHELIDNDRSAEDFGRQAIAISE